jgi:hypothetical protein
MVDRTKSFLCIVWKIVDFICRCVGYITTLFLVILIFGYATERAGKKENKLPSSGFRLDITCDAADEGAQVFVDGELAGELRTRTYLRKPPDTGTVTYCGGVDIRILRGEAEAKYGVYDQIRAEPGKRELSVACPDGRRIARNMTVISENYIDINCAKGEITGGEP